MSAAARPVRILEVTSYPPPRAGWGIRVQFLKKRLERDGHECVVLNTGTSRRIPSPEYETVLSAVDFVRKVWRYSRKGFLVHAHANGDAVKGMLLALAAEAINLLNGRRPVLTFHAGAIQRYFPRDRARRLAPLFWLLFALPRTIICNSQAVRERIQGYGVPGAKIAAIPAFSREYLEFDAAPLPAELDVFLRRHAIVVFTYVRMRPLFFPVTLIDGMAEVLRRRPDAGLVLCGGMSHGEEALWRDVQHRIEANGLGERLCLVEDLDHDVFLTVLQRSTLYLRTHMADGVASSVLESLALGVPVVACENGTRPAEVVTFPASDAAALAAAVEHVIDHRAEIVAAMSRTQPSDTLTDEVRVLTT
jgi:glycosyltransferase involved in cell wall biosynthesis